MSKKIQNSRLSESSEEEMLDMEQTPKQSAPTTPASATSKKRKLHIAPVTTIKKPSSYELFGTDSEDDEENVKKHDGRKYNQKGSKKQSTPPPHRSTESEPKKRKPAAAVDSSKKLSARDLFGSDSDDEQIDDLSKPGKKAPALTSYFAKRIANGLSRQTDNSKRGSHYIELKVYKCEEIKNIQPMNRWRHAVLTIRNKTNDDTEAWHHLTDFVKATRQEFKECRPEIFTSYGFSCS